MRLPYEIFFHSLFFTLLIITKSTSVFAQEESLTHSSQVSVSPSSVHIAGEDVFEGVSASAKVLAITPTAIATVQATSTSSVPTVIPEPLTLSPGWKTFEPLPSIKEELVKASSLRDRILILPPQMSESYVDRSLKQAWEGNPSKLFTAIDRVTFRFRRDPNFRGSTDIRHDPEFFDLTVLFRERQMIFNHSQSDIKRARQLELPLPIQAQERHFMKGEGSAGIALLLPRIPAQGQVARAFLMCPRAEYRLKQSRKNNEIFYVESGYKLARVLFGVNAKIEGKALSGTEIGMARAYILTSSNIPPAQSWADENYAIDPAVSLTYLPLAKEQRAATDGEDSIVGAIEARLELQRAAGYKRTSVQRTILWAKEISLNADEPWFINLHRDRPPARVAPGHCYSVLLERLQEQYYSKEDFIRPSRLRDSASTSGLGN